MNPGIYPDLSNEDYRDAHEWVSCSQLKRRLPEHYKPFTGSPAADFGSVFHGRFSGDPTPVVPVDAATWTGKAAIQARDKANAAGAYAILERDAYALEGMEKAVRAHPEASHLMVEEPGVWELSVFSEPDGVPCRARFDRLTDSGVAVDVKTTKNGPGEFSLTRAVIDFGYDVQEAHYRAVAEAAEIELAGFVFVFVQNVEPFHVTVAELDPEFLTDRGNPLRELALQRYLHPDFTDSYPGERGRLSLGLPRWAVIE